MMAQCALPVASAISYGGAVLMAGEIDESECGSLKRSIACENGQEMCAALATLDALERGRLGRAWSGPATSCGSN